MLTSEDLLVERAHLGGGVQRIYRFKGTSYGLSLVNSPTLHVYPFAWEAAVLRFDDDGDWLLDYSTPLTNDVVVFDSEQEANKFINRARETLGDDHLDEPEHKRLPSDKW